MSFESPQNTIEMKTWHYMWLTCQSKQFQAFSIVWINEFLGLCFFGTHCLETLTKAWFNLQSETGDGASIVKDYAFFKTIGISNLSMGEVQVSLIILQLDEWRLLSETWGGWPLNRMAYSWNQHNWSTFLPTLYKWVSMYVSWPLQLIQPRYLDISRELAITRVNNSSLSLPRSTLSVFHQPFAQVACLINDVKA